MVYDLTPPERQKYIVARGKTIVTACPGSGKTTSIVYKLRNLCKEVEANNKHTGVLCLSFTNKAVNEIMSSFKLLHGYDIRYPHEVATIDSFITQNIVMPFWYLCEKCKSSPIIVNEEIILHNLLWRHYNDKEEVKEACCITGFGTTPHSCKPEEINYCSGKYYKNTTEISSELTPYASKVIEYRLSNGFLTSTDAMNVALEIITKYPIVADCIVKRFPYIIIDEAQDTSLDQFWLIKKFIDAGLNNIEFIGDINQSIYEWRFAKPDILERITKRKEWNHIPFTNNRRSVQRIIDLYSKLVPVSRRLPIISTNVSDKGIPIVVYRYDNSNSTDIIADFENRCKDEQLSEWMILTRGRSLGKILSGSREKIDYWKSPLPYMILKGYEDFQQGEISKAVKQLAYIWSMFLYQENEYDQKRIFIKKIIDNKKDSTKLVNMYFNMPDLSETFQSWTEKMQKFIKQEFELDKLPEFDVFKRKDKFDITKMSQTRISLFYGHELKKNKAGRTIQTIHSSKGASTDAVLLFLSSNNQGNRISLNLLDNRSTMTEMTEKHRLLYVACSRARQFLALAVPIDYPVRQIKKHLNGLYYEIKVPGVLEKMSK